MEMIDKNLIIASMDEGKGAVKFLESLSVRDAYNSDRYTLQILEEKEIRKRSVQEARAFLEHYLNTRIVPAQAELKDAGASAQ